MLTSVASSARMMLPLLRSRPLMIASGMKITAAAGRSTAAWAP